MEDGMAGTELSGRFMHLVLQCIEAIGAEKTNRGEIAKALGRTRSELARLFPTEDALWDAVTAHIERRIAAIWTDVESADLGARAKIRSAVAAHIGIIRTTPAVVALFLASGRVDHPALREGFARILRLVRRRLAAIIEDGKAAGSFTPDSDGEALADVLIGQLQAAMLQWMLNRRDADLVELAWQRLDAALALAAPPAPSLSWRAAPEARGSAR